MRLHGSKGQILIDDTPSGTPAPVLVASLNKFTIEMNRDRVDATCFGDTNKQWLQGLPNYQGSIGGLMDPDVAPAGNLIIFDIALGDVACFLKLIPSTLAATVFFSGLAYLDASLDVSSSGAVTVEGSWVAAGPWALTKS
jgi:hypothetical protein